MSDYRLPLWLKLAFSAWILFWALADPERNINWGRAPFGMAQAPLPEPIYLPLLMLGWVWRSSSGRSTA